MYARENLPGVDDNQTVFRNADFAFMATILKRIHVLVTGDVVLTRCNDTPS